MGHRNSINDCLTAERSRRGTRWEQETSRALSNVANRLLLDAGCIPGRDARAFVGRGDRQRRQGGQTFVYHTPWVSIIILDRSSDYRSTCTTTWTCSSLWSSCMMGISSMVCRGRATAARTRSSNSETNIPLVSRRWGNFCGRILWRIIKWSPGIDETAWFRIPINWTFH